MMNFRALLAITLLAISAFASSETRLPHIVILATGGTIARFSGQQYPDYRVQSRRDWRTDAD